MGNDQQYSGKSLEECIDLLREDFENPDGQYRLETVSWALESLSDSPDSMNAYFDELSKLVGESVGRQEIREQGNTVQDLYIESARTSPEEIGRMYAASQLMHVLGKYVIEGKTEIPKKWNAAVEEIRIPENYLS